ncbi:uncharacterized protein Ppi1 [Drosophila tropicalis]|uniref:uncharacterized protein Ppi1 n=1 Tax=Drosophila tropicalis TaxID=46794 RepID=UPI0035ABE778
MEKKQNKNQNRKKNGNNNQANQNANRKKDEDTNGSKEERDKEIKEQEQKMKEHKEKEQKKESRKDRERQNCLLTNKLARDKKDYMLCSTRQYELDKDRYSKKDTDMCCSSCPPRDAAAEVRCPGPGKKVKPNKDNMRCFTANMICQKLYMPGRDFECQDKLKIMVDICKGCKPVLKADRINVNCLPQEPSKCFAMEAECLQQRLEEGILLTVIYKNREIGHGCYVLPESCILRLMNSLGEVTHTANVELTCRGCTVGMCTVHLGLQMRCQELKLVKEWTEIRSEGGMDLSMDSMSFPSLSTDPCAGFMASEEDFFSEGSDSCCHELFGDFEMKDNFDKENVQPEKLVDMAGPYCYYEPQNADDGCLAMEASQQFSPKHQTIYGDGCTNRMHQTISVPQLKQTCVNTSRFCHVCKEDVSWLPKIAACPHCGYKPVPLFIEKPYDENATADDLLHCCLEQQQREGAVSSEPEQGHQISEVKSSEALQNLLRNYEQLRQSIKNAENKEQKKSQANTSFSNKGPTAPAQQQNMAAVFTELKNMFKLKDDDTKAKIEEICQQAQKLSSKTHQKKGSKVRHPSETSVHKKKQRRQRKKPNFKSKVYAMTPRLDRCSKNNHDHNFDGPSVPAHMGWLWTSNPLAKKRGWRPGSIRRSTKELMRYFLRDFPLDTIPVSRYMSYYKQKQPPPSDKAEELVQKPTLYIEKRNDEYIITLHPLKSPGILEHSANPYVNMKPVQFRIVKNPLLKEIRDLKRCLKGMGFKKCTCHKPVIACFCRSFIEKKQLIDKLQKECQQREMESVENALVLSDTSDSEAEFEFGVTPPAGLIHPERLKKTTHHIINAATQYDENDWVTPSMFPHSPNRFMQYGACVVGERKKEFNWIYGKGKVHEEPKLPLMRNKPKKKESKKKLAARQAGGFAREDSTSSLRRSKWPLVCEPHSDYPLSEERMRRLDQAAYPPTDPQRRRKQRQVRFAAANSFNSNELP